VGPSSVGLLTALVNQPQRVYEHAEIERKVVGLCERPPSGQSPPRPKALPKGPKNVENWKLSLLLERLTSHELAGHVWTSEDVANLRRFAVLHKEDPEQTGDAFLVMLADHLGDDEMINARSSYRP